MYKLLTEEEREKVLKEYSERRFVVILGALILILIVAMVGLFPSYLLSNVRQREVEERVRITGEAGLKEEDRELQAWLTNLNFKLRMLSPKLAVDRPSGSIQDVLKEKIPGIRLEAFSWSKIDGKIFVMVSGVAQNRQTLLAFENKLNASRKFDAVTLPLSSLVRDRDIDFQVRLSPLITP